EGAGTATGRGRLPGQALRRARARRTGRGGPATAGDGTRREPHHPAPRRRRHRTRGGAPHRFRDTLRLLRRRDPALRGLRRGLRLRQGRRGAAADRWLAARELRSRGARRRLPWARVRGELRVHRLAAVGRHHRPPGPRDLRSRHPPLLRPRGPGRDPDNRGPGADAHHDPLGGRGGDHRRVTCGAVPRRPAARAAAADRAGQHVSTTGWPRVARPRGCLGSMRLYHQLLAFMVAATLLPTAALGWVLLTSTETQIIQRIRGEQVALARAAAVETSATLMDAVESLGRSAELLDWSSLG